MDVPRPILKERGKDFEQKSVFMTIFSIISAYAIHRAGARPVYQRESIIKTRSRMS